MRQVSISESFKIYYKADDLETGLDVSFRIWNDEGTQLSAGSSGQEIGTDGVYYVEYVAPGTPGYLLVIGSDGSVPKPEIIRVGTPATPKAFYVHGYFKENQTLDYDIYDANGDSVKSGQLTSIVAGFYSTGVFGLTPPWFFQVYPRVKRNKVYA
jgi:hypothetical protein